MNDLPSARDCEMISPLLPLYAGGDLSDREMDSVERHMSECKDCKSRLDQLTESIGLLHRSSQMDQTPADYQSVWPAVAARVVPKSRRASSQRFNGWIPALVVAASVLLVLNFTGAPSTPTETINSVVPVMQADSPVFIDSDVVPDGQIPADPNVRQDIWTPGLK